jgi:hypothetical protein
MQSPLLLLPIRKFRAFLHSQICLLSSANRILNSLFDGLWRHTSNTRLQRLQANSIGLNLTPSPHKFNRVLDFPPIQAPFRQLSQVLISKSCLDASEEFVPQLIAGDEREGGEN